MISFNISEAYKKGYPTHNRVISLFYDSLLCPPFISAPYAMEIGPPLILPAVQMRLIATI